MRSAIDTEQLEQWRADWASSVNRHLERHGHEARVDHRSLEAQGVDREPEPKQGPIATEMERQGRPSNAGDDRRAAQVRNDERAEIAAELAAVTAQIIDLAEERSKRAGQRPTLDRAGGSPAAETPQPEAAEGGDTQRGKVSVGTTAGGMVAQQMDALRRFKRNSEALEAQRQAHAEPAQAETPAPQPEPEKKPEPDERTRRFMAQLERNFTRDDKGDRSR